MLISACAVTDTDPPAPPLPPAVVLVPAAPPAPETSMLPAVTPPAAAAICRLVPADWMSDETVTPLSPYNATLLPWPPGPLIPASVNVEPVVTTTLPGWLNTTCPTPIALPALSKSALMPGAEKVRFPVSVQAVL